MTECLTVLPRYRSHKEVCALQIATIRRLDNGVGELSFVDPAYCQRLVTATYLHKHQPQVGGYWVQYADGYESWSPAEAFEAGYTRIDYESLTDG